MLAMPGVTYDESHRFLQAFLFCDDSLTPLKEDTPLNNKELAKKILGDVGGEENIQSYTNCVTRLRFQLKDKDKIKHELNDSDGVLGTQFQGSEYQVILGGKVAMVANELEKMVDLDNSSTSSSKNEKGNWLSKIVNGLSAILTPALPPIIAGGLLKGFIFLFMNFHWLNDGSDTTIFLNAMADAVFYFFPFLLANSSAKFFKSNEYLAMTLAGLLMYPLAIADGQQMLKVFGFLPIAVVDYSSSVLPIIFSVWLLKYVKQWLDRHIPEMVNMVFSPFLSLVIVAPIAMAGLAPLGYYIGEYIALGVRALIDFSPWLAGLVVGGTRPLLVLGGMHHAMNPIAQQEVASFGYSIMIAMELMSTFAQATAPLAIYFTNRKKEEKQIALSTVVPGFIGITEPSLYGVLVKNKGAMLAACLGGGVGAAISTMMGGRSFGFVMPGVLSMPAFMGEGFSGIVIGSIVSIALTFILTLVFQKIWGDSSELVKVQKDQSAPEKNQSLTVHSSVTGITIPLADIQDNTFSKEILGKTIAMKAKDGKVYAPFDGKIKALFPTKHAIGLETLDGKIELLIHIGIDTVQLQGEGFVVSVHEGDIVMKGDLLITFDSQLMVERGLDDVVIMIITNSQDIPQIETAPDKTILKPSDTIFTITL